jgi:hypothetical protein
MTSCVIYKRTKHNPDQLTLNLGRLLGESSPCVWRHRRQQALRSRAQWWFGQMRRKVDAAPDFPSNLPPH